MSFSDREGTIWMDGEWLDWRDAKIHVLTHTLHYGMGVFEGVRAYETAAGPAIFRLQDHTNRLFNSAKIMQMNIPFTKEALNKVQLESVARNGLSSAYIRPVVFYGSEGMGLRAEGLRVHVAVAAWSWGTYLGQESLEKGIRVHTSSFARHHVNVSMCRAKANGQYINSMMALSEALRNGYDEALLLDVDGFVAEGSGENFFLITNGIIYTPDLTSALDGITRQTIMFLARQQGLEIIEKRITRDEVYCADEAFFTGTAAEVTPIRELDGRLIGNGGRGVITESLQKAYFDLVSGKLEGHDSWISLIDEIEEKHVKEAH